MYDEYGSSVCYGYAEAQEMFRIRMLVNSVLDSKASSLDLSKAVSITDELNVRSELVSHAVLSAIYDRLFRQTGLYLALELVEFCVRNCGLDFARYIRRRFLKGMTRLLKLKSLNEQTLVGQVHSTVKQLWASHSSQPPSGTFATSDVILIRCQRKVIYLIQLWGDAFMMHEDTVPDIIKVYRDLRRKGYPFPTRDPQQRYLVKHAETSPAFDKGNCSYRADKEDLSISSIKPYDDLPSNISSNRSINNTNLTRNSSLLEFGSSSSIDALPNVEALKKRVDILIEKALAINKSSAIFHQDGHTMLTQHYCNRLTQELERINNMQSQSSTLFSESSIDKSLKILQTDIENAINKLTCNGNHQIETKHTTKINTIKINQFSEKIEASSENIEVLKLQIKHADEPVPRLLPPPAPLKTITTIKPIKSSYDNLTCDILDFTTINADIPNDVSQSTPVPVNDEYTQKNTYYNETPIQSIPNSFSLALPSFSQSSTKEDARSLEEFIHHSSPISETAPVKTVFNSSVNHSLSQFASDKIHTPSNLLSDKCNAKDLNDFLL